MTAQTYAATASLRNPTATRSGVVHYVDVFVISLDRAVVVIDDCTMRTHTECSIEEARAEYAAWRARDFVTGGRHEPIELTRAGGGHWFTQRAAR